MYLILKNPNMGEKNIVKVPDRDIRVHDFGMWGERMLNVKDDVGERLLNLPDSPFRRIVQHLDEIIEIADRDVPEDGRTKVSNAAAQVIMFFGTPFEDIKPTGKGGEIVIQDGKAGKPCSREAS